MDGDRHAATIARLDATNASLKTMLERSKTLPSWPEMARTLATLVEVCIRCRVRLDVLGSGVSCFAPAGIAAVLGG